MNAGILSLNQDSGAMSPRAACDGGQSRPDWRLPAARCALEVTLILLIAAYLWLHVGSDCSGALSPSSG